MDTAAAPSLPEKGWLARWPIRLIGKAIFILGLVVLFVAGGGVYWGLQTWRSPGGHQNSVLLVIPPGAGLQMISDLLYKSELVPHPLIFKVALTLQGQARSLQAGEYLIPARASPADVARQLTEGQTHARTLTIPEGLSSVEIAQLVNQAPGMEGRVVADFAQGELLPETYAYEYGVERQAFLHRLKDSQKQVLGELWDRRAEDSELASPEEAIILASMIEAEAQKPEEFPLVSSVFHNRLQKNMRLQSDPTVVYARDLVENSTEKRPIRRSDLRRDHPYNTYQRKGLPPGPINHPGRMALEAALNPAKSDYLYFVADGKGGHRFAKTLAEHNRNVRLYRKGE